VYIISSSNVFGFMQLSPSTKLVYCLDLLGIKCIKADTLNQNLIHVIKYVWFRINWFVDALVELGRICSCWQSEGLIYDEWERHQRGGAPTGEVEWPPPPTDTALERRFGRGSVAAARREPTDHTRKDGKRTDEGDAPTTRSLHRIARHRDTSSAVPCCTAQPPL
jgi:hypothetical protein